ncbi:MAG: phage major capsid protein, P2 family [Pusillimonas sp.]|nr:phage major capsid protein, P2 family [Pusillimonas sp.]MBC41324.1 phage major capsid protein, P2 family [Pusillimonas sp.]HCP77991.1 phage major capsid protein, P2 family [Pusillimonas sp.]|tara:strand:- start:9511 stop:10533 length:1023 start_codon:yes stop_codon:yes gene_type:complete
MRNDTRLKFNQYISRLAALNGVSESAVVSKFAADPSVQQTLENKIQESSEFLKSINTYVVDEQEGEKIGMGVTGPIASRTDTNTNDRTTRDVNELDDSKYRCEQTNYDTHIRYSTLDAWAKFKDFQMRLSNMIVQRIALDRIMIGFNGTSVAATTNLTSNPLLQDVNIGWLQKIRTKSPSRHMFETVAASNKVTVGGASDEYKNIDALVFDVVSSMIDPWYRNDTQLVAIVGRKLMSDKYFPLVNKEQPSSEKLASDIIIGQKRIGNQSAIQVPHFPDNAILITRLDNISVYAQSGTQRRSVIDNPKRDRIETYQSSNDAFELEDYGCAALIENIEVAAG